MRAQIIRKAAQQALPMGQAESIQDQPMLSRWSPADKRFFIAEVNWNDPLDVAVALQVVRFRSGVDRFDA